MDVRALEVGSRKHAVAVSDERLGAWTEVANEVDALRKLYAALARKAPDAWVVMEATGVYHWQAAVLAHAAGLKVAKPDNCPLLEAENLRIDAEAAFIQSLGDLPGMATFKSVEGALTLELRAKIVDCGLRLVVPLVADADGVLKRLLSGPTPATN